MSPAADRAPRRPDRAPRRPPKLLLAVTLLVALWGLSPPWSGPPLGWGVAGVHTDGELLDHVAPGLVVAGVAVAGLAGRLSLAAALAGVLASLWMAGTHVALLEQAAQDRVGHDAALFHSLPGLLLVALTVAAAAWAWRQDARAETHADPRRATRREGSQ